MNDVFLLLGSNLGDRFLYLHDAISAIIKMGAILKTSAVYETQAWGKTTEADYLNQVVLLQTDLSPRQLLKRIGEIELAMGRKREEKWGSRIIDIDILFYGDQIIKEPDLIIPHPELHHRRFTMEPLSEIAPDLVHPVFNKSVLSLKNNLKDCLIVKKL